MDAFWGPLMIYGGMVVIGVIVIGCSVPLQESHDRDAKKIGETIMVLGGAVAGIGVAGGFVKLLGELIEAVF